MEKQTKILLGVGAVIAAYLILKPKKAAGQSDFNQPLGGDVTPTDGGETWKKVCPKGQRLQLVEVNCIVAPCPPRSMCIPTTLQAPPQPPQELAIPDLTFGRDRFGIDKFGWVSGWNKTQVKNNNSNADDLAVFA